MEKADFTRHISKGFNKDLETIFHDTNKLFKMVGKQLDDTLIAFFNNDQKLAQGILEREELINKLDIDIIEECVKVIVLRQPVAMDMRLVMTVSNIANNLETIGDKCVSILRLSHDIGHKLENMEDSEFNRFSLDIRQSLETTLDAFNHLDSLKALLAIKTCYEVQLKHESMTRKLILAIMQDGPSFKQNLDLLWLINLLADINDNVNNIGKVIIYLIKGKDMRHSDFLEIEREVKGEIF